MESLPNDQTIEDIISIARALSYPVRARILFALLV